jgi:hypothetical protein
MIKNVKVDKQAFDALLGKLLRTPPLPKAAIRKRLRITEANLSDKALT